MHDPSKDPRRGSLYMSYVKGWRDGAAIKAMDPRFTQHPDPQLLAEYNQGYTDGYHARQLALHAAAERIGYEVSILRTQETER